MAEFDPKAYLAKKQESAFDPAAYVARKQAADPSVMEHRAPPAAETAHNVDQLDAAAMGLGHGASLGLDDEVSGVARGALHVGKEAAASALGDNTVGRSLLREQWSGRPWSTIPRVTSRSLPTSRMWSANGCSGFWSGL